MVKNTRHRPTSQNASKRVRVCCSRSCSREKRCNYQNRPKYAKMMLFRCKKNAPPALTGAKSAFSPPTRQSGLSDRCRPRPGHTLRGKHKFLIALTLKSSGSIRIVQIDGSSWALCSTTLRMPAARRVNSKCIYSELTELSAPSAVRSNPEAYPR